MKKIVQVVMLPTKIEAFEVEGIYKEGNNLQISGSNSTENCCYVRQHLYFISNEESIQGDYFISPEIENRNRVVRQVTETWKNELSRPYKYDKIVATTDKSLNLPLIPQSFVEDYVAKNGTINQVEVFTIGNTEEIATYSNIVQLVGAIKRQTVEEAAEEYRMKHKTDTYNRKESFIAGANWAKQQKS